MLKRAKTTGDKFMRAQPLGTMVVIVLLLLAGASRATAGNPPSTAGNLPSTAGNLLSTAANLPSTTGNLLSTAAVYRLPSQVLVDIVDAPKTPWVRVSPDREWLVLMGRPNYPSIAELAEREIKLAGLRIKPQINAPSRAWTANGIAIVRMDDLSERQVSGLPDNPRIQYLRWSPDGKHFLFTNTTADGVELWVTDMASASAVRLTGPVVSLTSECGPCWLADSKTIVLLFVPRDRGAEPIPPRVPGGPIIQESIGRKAPARTYADLLKNEHDEELFEYYLTSQIVRVTLKGEVTPVGQPGIVWDFGPSPDGEYILVHTLHRPYSYIVPAGRFPMRIEVLDMNGRVVHEVADHPLRDEIPIARGSTYVGPRSVQWRSDAGAMLSWVEALDGGDAAVESEERDRVFLLDDPFTGVPETLMTFELRFGDVSWGTGDLAIATEWWWETRTARAWRVHPDAPEIEPDLLVDRSWEDRYNDPGNPVMVINEMGRSVLLATGDGLGIYSIGDGASPEGDRPFLDVFDLNTRESTRLFRSEAPYYERPVALLTGARHILTRRESVDEVPNYFLRDLETGELTQITTFPHPTPQLLGIEKELITYEREDGLQLSGTLYLPADYDPDTDGPLPMVMWAYPREFKSADAAGQIDDSPYRFDRVGWWSPLLWLTQGYSVLDGPAMAIVGEGDEDPNDTYVSQLVSSAAAAVDEVVRRRIADRDRIAIGGHSYGAFMTANLLAHSDLFAAGLARTGAYNRTLTPFGFQSEDRTLWEAPNVYFEMSPFMHADKVNEPLLMVHGEADNNSGTFPMQSERFYSAVKGLGGTVRLVMFPHESHSYRARESLLHLLWETEEWLDTYVKNRDVSDVGE